MSIPGCHWSLNSCCARWLGTLPIDLPDDGNEALNPDRSIVDGAATASCVLGSAVEPETLTGGGKAGERT